MNITRNECWSTPIWEIDTPFDSNFNKKLLEEISSLDFKGNKHDFNVWNIESENVQELKKYQLDIIRQETKEYAEHCLDYEIFFAKGWINVNPAGVLMPIHDHGHSVMATTYYIQAKEDCGDLILVDPRGAHNFRKSFYNSEDSLCKRIKPVESKLVMFPAYLMHMVDINHSNAQRISLSSNVDVVVNSYKTVESLL